MRSLGEFFGHIVKAVRTDPRRQIVSKRIEQQERNGMVLRRTTIEEIELPTKRQESGGP